jgi:hypothetical protein
VALTLMIAGSKPDDKNMLVKVIVNLINKAHKFFYNGLQAIKSTFENTSFGNCKECKFSVDHSAIEKNFYEVCKY